MDLRIGQLAISTTAPMAPKGPAATAAVFGLPAPADTSIPDAPPPEVLDEVAAARDRAAELAASNRELHFRKDEATGRVVVQVRDLAGNVIRTIPPSEALAVMSGDPV